jgi:hypothetical protein
MGIEEVIVRVKAAETHHCGRPPHLYLNSPLTMSPPRLVSPRLLFPLPLLKRSSLRSFFVNA